MNHAQKNAVGTKGGSVVSALGHFGGVWLCAALSVSSFLSGCGAEGARSGEERESSTGRLAFALVGVAESGSVYRLRDGMFEVTNVNTDVQRRISTEEDPSSPELFLDLPVGGYSVHLQPGYRVEQLADDAPIWRDDSVPDIIAASASDGGPPAALSLKLLSPNPTMAFVHENSDVFVDFTFQLNGTTIATKHGGLIINAEFIESQAEDTGCAKPDAGAE
jgi:hypothetical protein